MVFSSTVFIFLFLPLVLAFYYLGVCLKNAKFKNIWLLIASLGFYAWGEPVFVFVMMASIIVNYFLCIFLDNAESRQKRKLFMVCAVVFNTGLLFVFKYISFVSRNLALLLKNDNFTLNIALPIGISFWTFQVLSYILDVYYRRAHAQKNIFKLALYISMFPQLIAGPIVRYNTIESEIEERTETLADFSKGAVRFIIGFAKKLLLANYLGYISDSIFSLFSSGTMNETLSAASAWLGALCWTLQIYFDFSAYSDMAIGLGLMFGFHFAENFNYPYIAKSITDFWRRWHISLSTWFRDYVYIPLGGNRVSKPRLVFNLFVVWTLTGLWHGANWTFVVWGLFYFVLLTFERFTRIGSLDLKQSLLMQNPPYIRRIALVLINISLHIYALFFIIIAWVIFRADTLSDAWRYIRVMFGTGGKWTDSTFFYYMSNIKLILPCALVFSTPLVRKIWNSAGRYALVRNIVYPVCLIILFIVSVLVCIKSTYNPFIYFNF